ncbi:electron transport complex subunit RsxB [Marinicella sp. W31]|uniref:electron transport complex subunit RsxB n=1 Tax=Marinicella sp. W31 TaxID=3023713 RepID=UPI003756E2FE
MSVEFIIPLLGMLLLSLLFGGLIVFVARKFRVEGNPVVEQINQILPQTQCGQCTYPGCKPYAEAIANGDAPINQCPPGGDDVIRKLADLLDVEVMELNPDNGEISEDTVVEIVEQDCIGCTKCIQVCPVDAIVGAAKKMHTVIADECTGCDLCIPACPVDCIVVVKAPLPGFIHRMERPQLLNTIAEAKQW